MKVLQTLGRHKSKQEGVFQYKRTSKGVFIDASVGHTTSLNQADILITNAEWAAILDTIEKEQDATFRLSRSNSVTPNPPNQVLYEVLSKAIPSPTNFKWQDSWKSYICAILEHEGSIDLYHGGVNALFIALARDIP